MDMIANLLKQRQLQMIANNVSLGIEYMRILRKLDFLDTDVVYNLHPNLPGKFKITPSPDETEFPIVKWVPNRLSERDSNSVKIAKFYLKTEDRATRYLKDNFTKYSQKQEITESDEEGDIECSTAI